MAHTTKLQEIRRQLGYSAATTISLLTRRAAADRVPIMTAASLKTKLSRWENGHEAVGLPEYRRLFREIYGRTNEELGFPPDEPNLGDDLRARLAAARTVDAATVATFLAQIEHTRSLDRQFGGLTQLDQLRQHIDHVTNLLAYGPAGGHRPALAAALTGASTLAGWQALDRDDTTQAWQHYERAKHAAREAESPLLLAHATAEQAVVLTALGENSAAVDHTAYARDLAHRAAPPLLRAWLAAAHGETLAIVGDRSGSLRAFDTAEKLLPNDGRDPALPSLFLAPVHLDRWRGNALTHLGDPGAVDRLTDALTRLPDAWVRARAKLLVDLAFAHAASGDRDAALTNAREARRLGRQISSDLHLRRLARLVLPGGIAA